MRLKKFIKNLIWLVKNKDKIEALLEKPVQDSQNTGFSLQGVPDFQLNYVKKLLGEER